MRVREERGNIEIELTEIGREDWITFTVNGEALFAIDMMYTKLDDGEVPPGAYGAYGDPNPGAPAEPHVNIGWWPGDDDTGDWEVIAHIPLSAAKERD